ncbi:MAG: hypothetical protein WCK31_03070 [bacterium]
MFTVDIVRIASIPSFLLIIIFSVCKLFTFVKLLKTEKIEKFKLETVETKLITFITIAIISAILLLQLVTIVKLPPTNWDSMTYHLAKIGFSLQYKSMILPSGIPETRIYSSPWNSEIANVAFFSAFNNDILVELPQLLAAIGIIYLLINYIRPRKIWVSIIFFSIPIFVTQMVTTQNDLIFFFLAVYVFTKFDDLTKNLNVTNVILFVVSCCLIIGTKVTGIPVIAVIVTVLSVNKLYCILKNKIKLVLPRRITLFKISISLLVIIVLGLFAALPSYYYSKKYFNDYLYQPQSTAVKFSIGFNTVIENIKHFGTIVILPQYLYHGAYNHDTGVLGETFMLIFGTSIVLFLFSKKFRNKVSSNPLLQVSVVFLLVFITIHYPDDWDLRLIMFSFITLFFILINLLIDFSPFLEKLLLGVVVLGSCLIIYTWAGFVVLQYLPYLDKSMTIADYKRVDRASLSALYNNIDFNNGKSHSILLIGSEDTWVYPYFNLNSLLPNTITYDKKYEKNKYDFIVLDQMLYTKEINSELLRCNTQIGADGWTLIYARDNKECKVSI